MFGYTRHLFPNMLVDGTGAMGSKPTYKKSHNKFTLTLPVINYNKLIVFRITYFNSLKKLARFETENMSSAKLFTLFVVVKTSSHRFHNIPL